MGAVTIRGSTSQTSLGLNTGFSTSPSPLGSQLILAFKSDQPKKASLVKDTESAPLSTGENNKQKRVKKVKSLKKIKSVVTDGAFSCTIDLDYDEAAAKLENICKLSLPTGTSVGGSGDHVVTKHQLNKRMAQQSEKDISEMGASSVRNLRKVKRLRLDQRISVRRAGKEVATLSQRKENMKVHDGYIERLLKEYAFSTHLVSFNWKKMKMPPVLSTSEHAWLFKLMQPMKALTQVKENVQRALGREARDAEVAAAANMSVLKVRRCINVGQAARNKLIKHNLRLVMFVIKKYFQELASSPRYPDLCQAGVMGLITAIDRFKPERSSSLSTYGSLAIRHAIVHSMTLSSLTKVSCGLEPIRVKIQKAKVELFFEHEREPTEEEITKKVGISPGRYDDVMRAFQTVGSLNSRHPTMQEELINMIADVDVIGGYKHNQLALLRLAIDDVLDSLKPNESLVIRQRYGLDGKGSRTLREIGANLNMSYEMVRLHELKALLKLKHPTRVYYLQRYIS